MNYGAKDLTDELFEYAENIGNKRLHKWLYNNVATYLVYNNAWTIEHIKEHHNGMPKHVFDFINKYSKAKGLTYLWQ